MPFIEDNYQFTRASSGIAYTLNCTRDEWLAAILTGDNRPKPPEWWLAQQELEGRNRTTASIIWTRNYKPDRMYVIWDQAPDDDFFYLGYRQL